MRIRVLRWLSLTLFAAGLLACGGGDRAQAPLPPLDVEALAGPWFYATPDGDTLSITVAVSDTVLTASGYFTNGDLTQSMGGLVTRIPIVATGWASPTRHRLHGDVALQPGTTLANLYGNAFDGEIDARILDLNNLMATLVVRLNDEVIWQEQEEIPIDRQQ